MGSRQLRRLSGFQRRSWPGWCRWDVMFFFFFLHAVVDLKTDWRDGVGWNGVLLVLMC